MDDHLTRNREITKMGFSLRNNPVVDDLQVRYDVRSTGFCVCTIELLPKELFFPGKPSAVSLFALWLFVGVFLAVSGVYSLCNLSRQLEHC